MRSKVTVALSQESFPPYDIIAMVEVRRCSALQTSGMRSRIVGLEVPRGSPRYVNGIDPTKQPNRFAKVAAASAERYFFYLFHPDVCVL